MKSKGFTTLALSLTCHVKMPNGRGSGNGFLPRTATTNRAHRTQLPLIIQNPVNDILLRSLVHCKDMRGVLSIRAVSSRQHRNCDEPMEARRVDRTVAALTTATVVQKANPDMNGFTCSETLTHKQRLGTGHGSCWGKTI